jgi:hypothetical protein
VARAGAFDPNLVPAGWYDESSVVEGFFDGDFIPFPTSGAYVITALVGTYAITGQNATILRSKVLLPLVGTYALTGQNATILRSKALLPLAGTYSINGQPAILTWSGTPTPVAILQDYIELRSFTEKRGFY